MSPDRRPGIVLSRRKFTFGSAATLLLAACGQNPQIPNGDNSPDPIRLPIPNEIKFSDSPPKPDIPENNREVSALKTEVAVQQAIIDAYKEPNKVPPPTRTPVLVQPVQKASPIESPKPVGGLKEARDQVFPTWLNELTRNRGSLGDTTISQLIMANYFKGEIFDNKGAGVLDPINPQELIQRFDRNRELNLSFRWMTQDYSGQGLSAVFRTVSGLAEINRVSITQLQPGGISPADLSNGIDWNGLLMMQIAYRAKYAVLATEKPTIDVKYSSEPLRSEWSNDVLAFRLQHGKSGWGFPRFKTLQEKIEQTMMGISEYPLSILRVGDVNRQSNQVPCREVGKVCNFST